MENGNLAVKYSPTEIEVVPRTPSNTEVSRTDLERILNGASPQTAATELAVVDLMQSELQRFELSLNSKLDEIISEIYYSEIPQRLIDNALGRFKQEAKEFVRKNGHNLAFIAAFAEPGLPEAATHFYNGTSKEKIVGKRFSDPSLIEDLIEVGREDGAMLINPNNRKIFKKNVFFFNLDLGYDAQGGLSRNELRTKYGFKDPDVNCRHFAALMMSRYIPGPVFTWSEKGYFRAYKNGKIIDSTYPGEMNGNCRPYLLDNVRSKLEEASKLYQNNMKSEIEEIAKRLIKYLSFDKKKLKEKIYGLRTQYGHGPAGIFVVGEPTEDYTLNGSISPEEGVGMDVGNDGFESYFSTITHEDGACFIGKDGILLRKNAQFINLGTDMVPEGMKGGARTLKSGAFAAATHKPTIVSKENGVIKRLGVNPDGELYSLTLSDKPDYTMRNIKTVPHV